MWTLFLQQASIWAKRSPGTFYAPDVQVPWTSGRSGLPGGRHLGFWEKQN